MIKKGFVICIWCAALLASGQLLAQANAYEQELSLWHQKRIEALKADNGWLNLAGLLWLKPGKNSFGSAADNDLIFPEKKIAEYAGYFTWQDKEIWLYANKSISASINGVPFQSAIIYHADSTRNPTTAIGTLRFTIIKRNGKPVIRLRDLDHELVKNFGSIPRFSVDPAWRIEAKLIPATAFKTIAITNIIGETMQLSTPGNLVFEKDGKTYSLQTLSDDGKIFVVFGDETNAETTYGSGRFLYVDKPNEQGITILDFNKAINPPCAFTPYATCPLPPKQNQLPIKIETGEKDYGRH